MRIEVGEEGNGKDILVTEILQYCNEQDRLSFLQIVADIPSPPNPLDAKF